MKTVEMNVKEGKDGKVKVTLSTKDKIIIYSIIGVGCFVSYKIGHKWCLAKVDVGLKGLFKADPTLKEHMVKALTEAYAKKLMENN